MNIKYKTVVIKVLPRYFSCVLGGENIIYYTKVNNSKWRAVSTFRPCRQYDIYMPIQNTASAPLSTNQPRAKVFE